MHLLMSLKEQTMIIQNNPCESCIHQSKSWNDEPCYRCGSENDYAWCEDEHGNFPNVVKGTLHATQIRAKKLK